MTFPSTLFLQREEVAFGQELIGLGYSFIHNRKQMSLTRISFILLVKTRLHSVVSNTPREETTIMQTC